MSHIKSWQLILAFVIALGTVIGLLARQRRIYNHCQAYLKTADEELSRDNFDKALEHLQTAKSFCNDEDVNAREAAVQIFKAAVNYDQVRLVRDSDIVRKVDENLRFVRNLTGENAELRVLQGIIEELSDRPGDATKQYEAALDKNANYAYAYNSWGYTIFKWRLKGSAWSGDALAKFKQAAMLKSDYAPPHINAAAVYLQLVKDAAHKTPPDWEEAKRYLPDAKASLEKASTLLPESPRVHVLWGHYHYFQGQLFAARGLTVEANESYNSARKSLITAKNKNPDIADASVLLGALYMELGMQKEALLEFENAKKLDDLNIAARIGLIEALSKEPNPDAQTSEKISAEAKGALALIETLRRNFTSRGLGTIDTDAKDWLATTIKEYEPLEELLKKIESDLNRGASDAGRKSPR